MSQLKKLASVLATFASITDTRKKKVIVLDRVLYIHYLVQFQKGGKEVTKALIKSGSEVNIITPVYAKQLGLQTRLSNVGAQKIDSLSLKTFEMVIPGFQVIDKLSRAQFF